MNERQEKILTAIVKEYTKTGLPVGSNILAENYNFEVSSATLRSDMANLEKKGLLYQPYTSAGRVPTDEGYRYFVEKIMPDRELTKKEQLTLQKELLQLKAQNNRLTRTTAKLLATLSGYVAITALPSKNDFSEFGLKSLLKNAKTEDLDDICHLAETLDCIDERCEDLMLALSNEKTQIFIGEKNPIFKSKNHSMIVSQYEQNGERGIVALIGPKNMKYEKNKSLIDYVKKILGGSGLFILFIYFV